MKLYNLYQEVIFEGVKSRLNILSENVTEDDIKHAIENKYYARIWYRNDEDSPLIRRTVQIYLLGITKAGNMAIRAYDISGAGIGAGETGWKMYRLNRMEAIEPTNKKWYNPVSDNNAGVPNYEEDDNEFTQIIAKVDQSAFGRGRSALAKPTPQPGVPKEPSLRGSRTVYNPEKEKTRPKPEPVKTPEPEVPKRPDNNMSQTKVPPKVAPKKPIPPKEPELGDNEEKEINNYGNTNTR